ncbi:hypothetical protein [Dyella silvatica]|uniref:hypothetical protein n=1 Tax=Dyella silvatica TaxID=2992128 RepID=UPI002259440F|nr:hypothetical protein [Dyella silvatica]
MIDARDPGTLPLQLTIKRGRGRPRKADALTPAQRQRRFRARRDVRSDYLRQRVEQALSHLKAGDTGLARHVLEELVSVTSPKSSRTTSSN